MPTATRTEDGAPGNRRRWQRWVDPVTPRSLSLWFGLGAPPIALAALIGLGDLIFELGCSPGVRSAGHRREILGLPLEAWALIVTAVLTVMVVAAGRS